MKEGKRGKRKGVMIIGRRKGGKLMRDQRLRLFNACVENLASVMDEYIFEQDLGVFKGSYTQFFYKHSFYKHH